MLMFEHDVAQRFRGGLVVKAHRLCVSLNSRLESNEETKEKKESVAASGRGGNNVEGVKDSRLKVKARIWP